MVYKQQYYKSINYWKTRQHLKDQSLQKKVHMAQVSQQFLHLDLHVPQMTYWKKGNVNGLEDYNLVTSTN